MVRRAASSSSGQRHPPPYRVEIASLWARDHRSRAPCQTRDCDLYGCDETSGAYRRRGHDRHLLPHGPAGVSDLCPCRVSGLFHVHVRSLGPDLFDPGDPSRGPCRVTDLAHVRGTFPYHHFYACAENLRQSPSRH